MYIIAIPSYGRAEILGETTLALLERIGNTNIVKIFVNDENQSNRYEKELDNYEYSFDLEIITTDVRGIGNTRNYIRNYFPVDTQIIMLDDDIKDICSINKDFNCLKWFDEVFAKMDEEGTRFAGANPTQNEFFMKDSVSTRLCYTGAHLIFEKIREKNLELDIDHFEDYLMNLIYFIWDGKIIRYNGVYCKTKYFNPIGGIIGEAGGKNQRLLNAETVADKLISTFKNMIAKKYSKKYDCINLAFTRQIKEVKPSMKNFIDHYYDKKLNYRVAIATYKRYHKLKSNTIRLLAKHNIPLNIIDIFVENENELLIYQSDEALKDINFIVTNTKGIGEKRNYMREYYYMSDNKYVFNIDDDMEDIYDWDKPINDLHSWIEDCFRETERSGYNLWGTSMFNNIFFMRKNITQNLKYISGACNGYIVDKTKSLLKTDFNHFEDFDFTCQHYLRDGGVCRFNGYRMRTKYFNDGGINESYGGKEERVKDMDIAGHRFYEKYPGMSKLIEKEYGFDIRLNHRFKIIS